MLSDKEKKAIELLEDHLICGNKEGVLYRNLRIISRIIEKQSKEIEELKEDSCCMTNCLRRDKEKLFLEDKIKAKIEIRKEEKENCKDSIEEKYLLREIYVLQSLLEKE